MCSKLEIPSWKQDLPLSAGQASTANQWAWPLEALVHSRLILWKTLLLLCHPSFSPQFVSVLLPAKKISSLFGSQDGA